MQPRNDEQGYATSQPGTWAAPPAYTPPPPSLTVQKPRPWIVAVASFVTLLVLIAGLGNQWVTDKVLPKVVDDTNSFGNNAVRAMLSYQWRFSPRGSQDFAHLWLGSVVLVVSTLVLTFLLVAVICRSGGFWQAFFGAWSSVVVATMIGAYVRVTVIDTSQIVQTGAGKATLIFFSALSPNSYNLAGGLGFGVVVGLVAGLTALLSRRTDVITAPVPTFGQPFGPPEQDEPDRPWSAPPAAAVPGPVATPSPWQRDDSAPDSPTTSDSRDEPQHTAVLPTVDQAPAASAPDAATSDNDGTHAPAYSADDQHTTQFPRDEPPAR